MNKIQITAVAALLLSTVYSSLRAAEGTPDLSTTAAAARQEADVPALGLMVVRGDEEPRIAVDGARLMGSDAAVTVEDKWHWGSITKSMTATLAARLVEKGTVAWIDTVGARLGKAVPEMNDAYRDVTFRHLLTHRAGLQPNIPLERFGDFGQTPDNPIADRLKWVRLALAQSPVGPKESQRAARCQGAAREADKESGMRTDA